MYTLYTYYINYSMQSFAHCKKRVKNGRKMKGWFRDRGEQKNELRGKKQAKYEMLRTNKKSDGERAEKANREWM